MQKVWKTAQKWELDWHGTCVNSQNEEEKQIDYALRMGLIKKPNHRTPYNFDIQGASILDIGSGPYSLLLKCENIGEGSMVVDPLMDNFPQWVRERYKHLGLEVLALAGEELTFDITKKTFDEVWLYNVLEHTYNPKKLLERALELGKIVRIFEWLNTPANIGHPQTLLQKDLDAWLGGEGKIEVITRGGGSGLSYYGVFKGKNYEQH